MKNCNFSVYTGEKAASGDIGIGIGTEDDTVTQRSTVESLLIGADLILDSEVVMIFVL